MLQSFTKYAGIAQTLIGILGATGFSPALGGTGGGVFNVLSGAVLSYLGFKGPRPSRRRALSVSAP
jgi:hypothetical protein